LGRLSWLFRPKNKKSVPAWYRLTAAVITEDAEIIAVVDFNLRMPGAQLTIPPHKAGMESIWF
jgi:hypothetical protein